MRRLAGDVAGLLWIAACAWLIVAAIATGSTP